jgi:hypothetical protein
MLNSIYTKNHHYRGTMQIYIVPPSLFDRLQSPQIRKIKSIPEHANGTHISNSQPRLSLAVNMWGVLHISLSKIGPRVFNSPLPARFNPEINFDLSPQLQRFGKIQELGFIHPFQRPLHFPQPHFLPITHHARHPSLPIRQGTSPLPSPPQPNQNRAPSTSK